MDTYIMIFCFFTAFVLVVMKLILEHQKDVDKANGVEQDAAGYTTRGMLKLIRQERKERKAEKKLAKMLARQQKRQQFAVASEPVKKPTIQVRKFEKK